jgi:cell fate regulator YaaT (PSP1 superfamily)
MFEIVGIKFPKDDKTRYYDANGIKLSKGELCIVEIEKGKDAGEVVEEPKVVENSEIKEPFPKVLRVATQADRRRIKQNNAKERRAYKTCLKKIDERRIPMKLVDVHQTFDGSKITFYFTAEGRVDFRELVKDLAHIFKMRIEMRQIGVRDEVKMFGGFGWCGRPLCCTTFLEKFTPVTIRMAKDQNLILTPTKISGLCGRLMCCLSFEHENYVKFRERTPKQGTQINLKEGMGIVIRHNLMRESISVKLEDGRVVEVLLEELEGNG